MSKGRRPPKYVYRMPAPEGSLGARLRAERDRRGWSQKDVSAIAGLSQGQLSKLELGKTRFPDPIVLVALEKAYELPPGTLTALAGYTNPKRVPAPFALVINEGTDDLEELMQIASHLDAPDVETLLGQARFMGRALDIPPVPPRDAAPETPDAEPHAE